MNNTDFMQKLLNGAQVEWKALSEIFHLKNGYTPSTSKRILGKRFCSVV
jgi:type I restriction enzyme S subunit